MVQLKLEDMTMGEMAQVLKKTNAQIIRSESNGGYDFSVVIQEKTYQLIRGRISYYKYIPKRQV